MDAFEQTLRAVVYVALALLAFSVVSGVGIAWRLTDIAAKSAQCTETQP